MGTRAVTCLIVHVVDTFRLMVRLIKSKFQEISCFFGGKAKPAQNHSDVKQDYLRFEAMRLLVRLEDLTALKFLLLIF